MSEFSKEEVIRVFQQLDFSVLEDAGDGVIFEDNASHLYHPRFALAVFEGGRVSWTSLQRVLDYEGINHSLFIAYHES